MPSANIVTRAPIDAVSLFRPVNDPFKHRLDRTVAHSLEDYAENGPTLQNVEREEVNFPTALYWPHRSYETLALALLAAL
jgi:hypothetical protein